MPAICVKGVRDGMVSHRHTNGNDIYLPAASTSAMSLKYTFEFLRFSESKNKASATQSKM